MTHDQNIIAAAVEYFWTDQRLAECLREFGLDLSACSEWRDATETAYDRLSQALIDAGYDWRDPFVRDRFRKGQGFQ